MMSRCLEVRKIRVPNLNLIAQSNIINYTFSIYTKHNHT